MNILIAKITNFMKSDNKSIIVTLNVQANVFKIVFLHSPLSVNSRPIWDLH